jgi:hypothetical protein
VEQSKAKLTKEDLQFDEKGLIIITLERSTFLDEGNPTSIIKLREPKMKDVKALDKIQGDISKSLKLVSVLANIPMSSVDEISLYDFNVKIAPVMEYLTGESQEIGDTV